MKCLYLFGILLLAEQTVASEKLGFVFELVRHGARAAQIPDYEGAF